MEGKVRTTKKNSLNVIFIEKKNHKDAIPLIEREDLTNGNDKEQIQISSFFLKLYLRGIIMSWERLFNRDTSNWTISRGEVCQAQRTDSVLLSGLWSMRAFLGGGVVQGM